MGKGMERLTTPLIVPKTGEVLAYMQASGVSDAKVRNKLGKYEDLEERGLLLRLPVPCGQWVYSAECGFVEPYIVASYTADKYGLWCLNLHGGLIGLWGKSVFATKAEAEAALERMGAE